LRNDRLLGAVKFKVRAVDEDEYAALVGWYWQVKDKVVPICPSQNLTWNLFFAFVCNRWRALRWRLLHFVFSRSVRSTSVNDGRLGRVAAEVRYRG
jgi:hypothetical protein